MSYKFMMPSPPTYYANSSGLKFRKFNFYPVSVPGSDVTPSPNPYGLSGSAWTTGVSGTTSSVDMNVSDAPETYVYRGYFKPDQTSASWQFRTTSNDGSWLWVDTAAELETTALDTANAAVKNGGQHTAQTVASSNIVLSQSAESDLYYAIALVFGNQPGAGSIKLEFRRDAGTWQQDGAGFYFHDLRRSDGFNPD